MIKFIQILNVDLPLECLDVLRSELDQGGKTGGRLVIGNPHPASGNAVIYWEDAKTGRTIKLPIPYADVINPDRLRIVARTLVAKWRSGE